MEEILSPCIMGEKQQEQISSYIAGGIRFMTPVSFAECSSHFTKLLGVRQVDIDPWQRRRLRIASKRIERSKLVVLGLEKSSSGSVEKLKINLNLV